jgi:hypothetical protein
MFVSDKELTVLVEFNRRKENITQFECNSKESSRGTDRETISRG